MINLFISSLFSTIILFSFGTIFQSQFFKEEKNKLKLYESGIYGSITLSFLALSLNFITPIEKIIGDIVLILAIIYLIYYLKNSKDRIEIIKLFFFVSCITFLLVCLSNINRPDAGFYHLPFISILHENKIIVGLANIHYRFGHISILQYLSSIFNNNFLKVEFITLPIASILSYYFYYLIKLFFHGSLQIKKDNIFVLLILIFSFYSFSRYSNFGNDTLSHLIFFLIIISLLDIKDFKKPSNIEIFKILLLAVFAFTNKTFMLLTLIIPALLLIQRYISNKKLNILINKKFFLCYFLLSLWLIKNILISGCVIYPIVKTCISSLSYSDIEKTKFVALEGEAWAKNVSGNKDSNLTRNEYVLNFNWFKTWKNIHLKKIIEKITPFAIFLLFYLILKIYFKDLKLKMVKKNKISNSNKMIFLFSLFFLIIWFYKFPLYRFGYSFLAILLISTFSILLEIFDNKSNSLMIKKINVYLISFALIGLVSKNIVRINNTEYTNYKNYPWPKIYSMSNSDINTKQIFKSIKMNGKLIYYYSSGEACMYSESPCSHYFNKNLKLKKKIGYKIIYF